MTDVQRPDPDALLSAIQRQEARDVRGKLKIFFGMAAGVGKTYAMLEAAHSAKATGVDVVVGYVVTHGRAETESLLLDLEHIPRIKIEYRGTVLEEMDTDAILARSPQLVLVDELAHTNAPGVRHAKRYMDILELLEAGIDVYTTVNVQHFESRADAVGQITGITVHETVPDSILDLADEIELIDLTPEELRKRLAEGKVYTPERVETAARNFFRTGNLTALREMALRLTAEHVDHQLQDYMDIKRIAGPWKSAERLMVAVGSSPFSEKLIRWTRRMAYNLEAPWLAAHIETTATLAPDALERLSHNLAFARQLGGEVVSSAGDNIAQELLQLARQHNVTQIIVGKPRTTRWPKLLHRHSLVDQIIDDSGDIDIYLITGDEADEKSGAGTPLLRFVRHSPWQHYLWALLIVMATTAINAALFGAFPLLSYLAVGLIELLAVLLIAIYLGRGPALLAATASAISWNFLFIDPRFTFQISRTQDVILFFLYFAIAIFVGNLAARLRSQERLAQYNSERTSALYALAHETATAVDMDDVFEAAVTQIGRVFAAEVAILPVNGSFLDRRPHPASTLTIDDKEFSVAVWAFENGRAAGRFTNTLALSNAHFLPLRTPNRTVGVIGLNFRGGEPPTFDQSLLLETFASQIASVIERELLDEVAEHNAMLRESERLYTTLLNSISHELRTPIATITGAAGSLLDPHTGSNETARVQLIRDIQDASQRLNRLVANLLDMSRLESTRLQLKLEWCDVGDIISIAVMRLESCLAGRPLTIQQASSLPLVRLDSTLMEQVLVNLLDNACTYTPPGTAIDIATSCVDGVISITVTDHGPGIAESDMSYIFDKFYRSPQAATGGTGLGLSISRGLVESHGGTLTAENVPGAGARFTIRLPAGAAPPPVQEAAL
jgi:two-component system sensor histidine kinase KdpD